MKPRILVVDDEPDICELLQLTLERMHLESDAAGSLQEARDYLGQNAYHLCLSDMRLPDGEGIELVRYLQKNYPMIPVAVITAHGNMDMAIETLKAGAFDFLTKPVDLNQLRNMVRAALRLSEPRSVNKGSPRTEPSASLMIGNSPAMQQARSMIMKLARNQAPVYIHGESGTGKELAAKMIHLNGSRAEAPFIPVNCGAIPEALMESEFFGHKKGSFTGAVSDKKGLFLAAQGGTLFLDEIADLPLSMQVKLLRVIQEKSVRAVGSEEEVPVDVRILSASHKDLQQMVQEGSFRQDLYYRLNVIELDLPSLRDRREDIPLLAESLLERLAEQQGMAVPVLEASAIRALQGYDFPGNVRELENILERALAMSEGARITAADLLLPDQDGIHDTSPVTAQAAETTAIKANPTPGSDRMPPLEDYLEDTERRLITQVLEEAHYNKTAAAKRLGISLNALRYRLRKLGME
ncbi:MAG: sigma-54-dependent Fis family transcriptional regulator [Gammaproteobacteria bacterium]|nr:MAG: sigma-54-dependent Fis family transcriptional regulator [Gammaproteobacteria bacterium]